MYCTIDDVAIYLPNNVIIEGTTPSPNPLNPEPDSVTTVNIEFYIKAAAQRINACLRTVYDVPLKKVNQGGLIQYPDPIPFVNAVLAAQMIYEQKLQGADREKSESQKAREANAEITLTSVQNGELLLDGQRALRSSRFVSNTLYPAPKNPAVEGRSKGKAD